MRHTGRFALALCLCVVLALAAVAGTIWRGGEDGLPVTELLRVEPLPADPTSPLDDHLDFIFEVLGGTRRFTAADVADRFVPQLSVQEAADGLNAFVGGILTDAGAVSFVRVQERLPNIVFALGVAEDGTTGQVVLAIADDGRIQTFVVEAGPSNPRRLQAWESALILLAGVALIVAAAAAWMYRAAPEAWTLLAASVPTLGTILVLSHSSIVYAAGRVMPSLVLVLAVALLVGPLAGRPKRLVVATAVAAAAAGALAPFVIDAALIGHPSVAGALADSETAYRVLLTLSAGLAAVAMGGVVALNLGRMSQTSRRVRPALWVAAAIAATWAIASMGAAVDYAAGDGALAAGPFAAVTWSALGLVPVMVIFRLLISRWDEVDASRARILGASDTSRRQMERDLHDGAQQRLVALGLRLQRARRLAGSEDRGELVGLLEDATKEVRDTIQEIRAVSRGAQPALLAERGLATAVDALAERAPVPVSIDITDEQLPADAATTAYYVVAEGLTNVAKHSMATNAQVSITRRNGQACVTIGDDGKGGAEIAPGSGLEGLNDRVAAIGGTFQVSSGSGGTTLEATIPCA